MVRLSPGRRHMTMMHQEEKVYCGNGSLSIEGLWIASGGDAGIVICHPHPQMGGSMYNNVVETIRDVFAGQNYSTLRFNFRGVGESTGRFDEGRGEVHDVLSACDCLKKRGIRKIILAGYSFGAWICCRLLKDNPFEYEAVILVSPPDKFLPFDWNGLERKVDLIITGSLDPFCDTENLKKQAERIGAKHLVLKAMDHFYDGGETQLSEGMMQWIKEKRP